MVSHRHSHHITLTLFAGSCSTCSRFEGFVIRIASTMALTILRFENPASNAESCPFALLRAHQ